MRPLSAILLIIALSISCTVQSTVTATDGEGWLDDNTFRAVGIGYPNPFDAGIDAKRTSAAKAANDIALASLERSLAKNVNGDAPLEKMRTFIQKTAAVVKRTDGDDGHCEITLEVLHTGLRRIVDSGDTGALP